MMKFWSNFAKEGKPGKSTNGIEWSQYNHKENSRDFMILDNKSNLKMESSNTTYKSLVEELNNDKRVNGKTYKILSSKNIKVKTGLLKNSVTQFYSSYFYNKKNKLPFITGKIAISKNNLIYSKGYKKITNKLSDKFTHYLRYSNDSIMISYKTLNKDNPKLNCRLKNFKKFSPKRIILDNNLNLNTKSYLFKTADKNNTIVFYNEADKSKIYEFKKSNKFIKFKI